MIPYFGTPISGAETVGITALNGGHAFISYAEPSAMKLVKFCQSFAVDNGAFSFWKSGKKTDWNGYYEWVNEIKNMPNFDWAIIPDVIGGSEEENDKLIDEWPYPQIGVPVWHMHESIDRLKRLSKLPRIAFGGSCQYKIIGNRAWWDRCNQAFEAICDENGYPKTKVHGLRMLSPKVFTKIPLASADSTALARNVGMDTSWSGRYQPPTKEARAMILRQRIEILQAAERWEKVDIQGELF